MTPDELAKRIKDRPFSAVAEDLMRRVVDSALPHVQSFTPVDTGLLVSSERTRVESGMRGFIETDTPYAIFQRVEFMQLGADAARADIEGIMIKVGQSWLEVLVK